MMNKNTNESLSASDVYDLLPLSEKTLLKRLRQNFYTFGKRLRNDRGYPCDYYLYDENDNAIAVIIYAKGRKLCMHGIGK